MKKTILTLSAFIFALILVGCSKTTTTPTTITATPTTVAPATTAAPTTTAEWTYIDSVSGLEAIADNLSGKYKLSSDLFITSAWTPIGSATTPFTGEFDGDGHTINGLTYTLSSLSVKAYGSQPDDNGVTTYTYVCYAGLFGYTKNASIHDVTISSATINSTLGSKSLEEENETTKVVASLYAGLVVGYAGSGTTIKDVVINDSTVSITSTTLDAHFGAIAGYNAGTIENVEIKITTLESASFAVTSTAGDAYVGLVAGTNAGTAPTVTSVVSTSATSTAGDAYVEGVKVEPAGE